uniref:Uncharacterized protein n=1 Tax=Ulva partita TaxID=1605170 RepID=A0A1C9ZPW3_9CHLO|nr:hypothetical protein [Ulva partita]
MLTRWNVIIINFGDLCVIIETAHSFIAFAVTNALFFFITVRVTIIKVCLERLLT